MTPDRPGTKTTWVSMTDIVGEVRVEMDNEFILHRCVACHTQIVAFIDDEADSLVYKQFCDCPLAKDTIEVTTITAECIEAQHALEQDSPDPPDKPEDRDPSQGRSGP